MIYLDSCAAAKLIHTEDESTEFMLFIAERAWAPLISSELLYPELIRAVCRHSQDDDARARILLQRILQVPINREILDEAATVGGPLVRTLDAIHLATALGMASELTAFVTYDKRLGSAAKALGLPVEAPA